MSASYIGACHSRTAPLFFADSLPREQALDLLEDRRGGHAMYLEALRALAIPGDDPQFVDLTLRWGIAFHEWGMKWCDEQLRRLGGQQERAA
jgi:hypothetical protein